MGNHGGEDGVGGGERGFIEEVRIRKRRGRGKGMGRKRTMDIVGVGCICTLSRCPTYERLVWVW